MSPESTSQEDSLVLVEGPGLQALGLGPEHLAALKVNGSIAQERRGRRMIVYKLRYRLSGCQRALYLGTDENLVNLIRGELKDLQASRRRGRELLRLEKKALALLRTSKQRLESQLIQAGFRFHGRAIRRPRKAK